MGSVTWSALGRWESSGRGVGGGFALCAYAEGLGSTANLGVWWEMWAELSMEKRLETG